MERIHKYSQLNVVYPEKEVFFRLGGNAHKTVMNAEQRLFFHTHAAKAYTLCHPQGRWMIKKISSNSCGNILFEDGNNLYSEKFSGLASGANFIWFAAVTAGVEVVSARDSFDDISIAAIYDAVAAEVADGAMDMLHKTAASELKRTGLVLSSKRYSPGYGDMSLEYQHMFFELLNMQEMGLTLTDECFIVPEKSVTSLAAVMVKNN